MKPPVLVRRKLTVDEYHRMAEAGILRPDERIELLDGEIIVMSPIGSRHMACVTRLSMWFSVRVSGRALVWVQCAIRLSQFGEPEPDVALLRFRQDGYELNVPTAEDTLLVIEVADSSLDRDRDVKLLMYALAGIAEVWIVDLQHNVVLVCRAPAAEGYRDIAEHGPGSAISPLAFPDLLIRYEEIFVMGQAPSP